MVVGLACWLRESRVPRNSSRDSAAVTLCWSLFQSTMVLGKEFLYVPHWWFSLGRTCVHHRFYCLHFVGNSPSSHPLTDGPSCIAWRICCHTICSAVCPISALLARESVKSHTARSSRL